MGSQIMKLHLQLCLLAVVCHCQDPTTTAEPTTTPETTEEATTIFVCPFEQGKCKEAAQCGSGEGRCNKDEKCEGDLKCGFQNCQKFHPCAKLFHRCCEENPESSCDGGRGDGNCCKREGGCDLGGGNCVDDDECIGELVCGTKNCKDFHPDAKKRFNCCMEAN